MKYKYKRLKINNNLVSFKIKNTPIRYLKDTNIYKRYER